MANPTAFLEYARELPPDKSPLERIRNWSEFHTRFASENDLQRQAARCMDCGTPFCHSGVVYDGAVSGCPLNNLIPEWNDLVYRGLWPEALKRLQMTNNFPEFTSRVCPAPCEGACTLGTVGPMVAIKTIESTLIDRGWDKGWIEPCPPLLRTGKKVAVVGSGPAGLACADQLNKAGHEVVVYERSDRIGGLLMYGIPNMKLDKSLVQRRVDLMEAEGVRFLANVEVGKNLPADDLRARFDAVILAGGASKPRDLHIADRGLEGIHFAMEYLTRNTKSLLDSKLENGNPILATGKDVVVIGGGDTGTDCVGSVLRHGCRSVTQLEILPRPPEGRGLDNPWPRWPRIFRADYGHEEAIALTGKDPRLFQVTAKRFIGNAEERVSEILLVDVEPAKDQQGRTSFREKPGTERVVSAQLVLIAMGFTGCEDTLPAAFGVDLDVRGNVKTDQGRFATSTPGVFTAGDMRRGQSLVVWAIHEGRGVAKEVDQYLMGETPLPG